MVTDASLSCRAFSTSQLTAARSSLFGKFCAYLILEHYSMLPENFSTYTVAYHYH